MYILPAEPQKTLVEFKGLEIMLFTYRAYTKHQDIHDQESLKRSAFLYSALQSSIQYCVVTACDIRVSPWEHQAGLLHAISPISMKLCQFKGSTPKLEKTNWFVFWIFEGEIGHPPGFIGLLPWKLLQIGQNIWSSQYNCIWPIASRLCSCTSLLMIHLYWMPGTSVSQFDWRLVNQPRQMSAL